MFRWLHTHLLPCPFKLLTRVDCPGCGFQRSVLALLQGDLHKSWALYPAAIPLLLFFVFAILDDRFKLDDSRGTIKKVCFIAIGTMILISYGFKLHNLYHVGLY